ncbi:MAG: cofactor-independent phosphoglycerate mutase [archaeon]|nr:cofactor-independent phosphoglycerate mutase [archaeon]
MKYILIIGDGLADRPLRELGGKTPLQVAEHPNMDFIAYHGSCGRLITLPQGLDTGTDVAIMSILGCDPRKFHTGRGPLEAASIGVELNENDVAFRCNLITEKNGILIDYSAGHIETEKAKELLKCIKDAYEKPKEIEFFVGVSYRHLLVLKGNEYSNRIKCTPPHDALNKPISEILPREIDERGEKTARTLKKMIISSKDLLLDHPINRKRIEKGINPANMIWPWGQGMKPRFQPFYDIYGIKGAVISAVDIVNGIGVFAGMDVIRVPGATGYHDTNYEGKADYALKSLKDHDFVLIHVEASDEASHLGDYNLKIKTIEDLDKRLIGRLLNGLKEDYTIAISPDHATPTELRTHARDPVPFAIFSTSQIGGDKVKHFDEVSVKEGSFGLMEGINFMSLFLGRGRLIK